jgi:hypothetical protein
VSLGVELELKVTHLLGGGFFVVFGLGRNFFVLSFENLNLVVALLVRILLLFDFIFHSFDLLPEEVLFVVKFVFQSQEVLVEGDAVSQKSFIAAGLVLLINLFLLEQLDLVLHINDLFLEVEDVLFL